MSLVENLYKKYNSFVIDIPHWKILDEGVTALWGPSGSGKSSVFRLLLGLDRCINLTWSYQSINLAALRTPDRQLGVVFQSLELFPHLTARENIFFAAKARNIGTEKFISRLDEFSELLGMQSFLDKSTDVLSGGEKQRVAIVRAVIGNPRILLLDEPFSSLDESLKQDARKMIKKVISKKKIPTVLITHDQRDVDELADKVTEIKDGRLIKGK